MAELKTRRTTAGVSGLLNAIEDPVRRKDCKTVAKLRSQGTRPIGARYPR
jgi:hypothetical protein